MTTIMADLITTQERLAANPCWQAWKQSNRNDERIAEELKISVVQFRRMSYRAEVALRNRLRASA